MGFRGYVVFFFVSGLVLEVKGFVCASIAGNPPPRRSDTVPRPHGSSVQKGMPSHNKSKGLNEGNAGPSGDTIGAGGRKADTYSIGLGEDLAFGVLQSRVGIVG